MEKLLTEGLAQLGITPPAGVAEKMARYGALLIEQNKVMNLTAITEPDQVARLHFLDSAALIGAAENAAGTGPRPAGNDGGTDERGGGSFAGKCLIDVGTGAGFPGMALKLLEPTLSLTLLDSLDKRLNWLGEVCKALDLVDVERLHARAEEQGLLCGYRDSFDFATARAVADLRLLCELCLPFVKVGGRFLAMKSAGCDGEVAAAERAVTLLGGRLLPTYSYHIPGADVERRVVVVEKISATPKGYPRRWAKMQKAPL